MGLDSILGNGALAKETLTFIVSAIFGLVVFFVTSAKKFQGVLNRRGGDIFIYGCGLIIAASVAVRAVMYIKCRSLWADEAALAVSIVTENWLELLAPPLSDGQSAPVLYVIAVKAIGSLFGYSEFSVRIFSMFAFIGFLACEAVLLKKAFNMNAHRIISVVAASALLPPYIWYSNEFKPYMGDVFFAVLTILAYLFYREKKLSLPALTASCILFMGFSYPALFFAGGVLLCEFLTAVYEKNRKRAVSVFVSGAAVTAVFTLYYVWWMAPAIEFMQNWWGSAGAETGTAKQIMFIFSGISRRSSDASFLWFFVPLALLGIYSSVKSGNKTACSAALSLLLAITASLLGKWPPSARLWLFLPAIVLIFTPAGFDFIAKNNRDMEKTGLRVVSGIIAFLFINCLSYAAGEKMYLYRQEVNPLVSYVRKNIKEGEVLYVYEHAVNAVRFKNGYASAKIGNTAADNIIYGGNAGEWNQNKLGNELNSILARDKAYLIFSHHEKSRFDGGFAVLRNYGALTEVMNVLGTPLYYFEKYAEKYDAGRIPPLPD